MDVPEFLRVFPMRGSHLMWLLGAGASASAGIPTAGDMIWDFKRRLYCSESKLALQSVPDIGDASFRLRLNQYFASQSGFPAPHSDDEYSFYFERTYAHERDRRSYINKLVDGKSPSQGHLAFASLVRLGQARIIWTTNFDRLIEDSLAQMLGTTSAFNIAGLDAPHLASEASLSFDRPYVVKLHGDFLSTRLKNTASELRTQDAELRRVLSEECSRHGLAVTGYSGRDESIMEALAAVIQRDGARAFPHGLFWFYRNGTTPCEKVVRLFALATEHKLDAHLVESDTFDELVHDLFTLLDNIPDDVRQLLDRHTQRLRPVPIPLEGRSWPIIRLNALPITSAPTVCRKVVCAIGGTGEVKKAIADAQAAVIAARRQLGVICFGSDSEVRRAFEAYNISEFDLYPIEARRLEFDSADLGLMLEALVHALVRERPLKAVHTKRGWKVHVDCDRRDDTRLDCFKPLRGGFCGKVPGTDLKWSEAVLIHIARRLERLWMLFEPSVWIDWPAEHPPGEASSEEGERIEDDPQVAAVKEFVRERSATRYNPELLKVFDAWAALITGSSTPSKAEVTLRALGLTDGVDASFTIQGTTAFSKRA